MFVQCNVGNAETFQGTGIFQQISWLIQVDKEELRRLGEALEMGQNRAVSKICLICGSEETGMSADFHEPVSPRCLPSPEKSHL